jgi:hypothetical protein
MVIRSLWGWCLLGTPVHVHTSDASTFQLGTATTAHAAPCRPHARAVIDVIRKEAWCFYRTISGVHLCWELEEPKGPNGPGPEWTRLGGWELEGWELAQLYSEHKGAQGYLAHDKMPPPSRTRLRP